MAAATGAAPRISLSAEGRVLRVRAPRDIQVLDPGYMIGGIDTWIQYACLGQLVNYKKGPKWDWQPSAMVDRAAWIDPTHLGFKLREGIQWSNGYGEVTSEDVKYSFERMKESQWEDMYVAMSHVDIIDRYSGSVVLEFPFSPIVQVTLCYGTGSILSKQAVEDAGGKYATEFPAICGPYRISEWSPKQRIVLTPNPLWTGPPVGIEEIHFINIDDEKTAELAYEAGDIDLTRIAVDSLPRYRENLPPATTLVELPGLQYSWVGMNTQHPKLKDIRVRKAIQHAIDVDLVLDGAYGGLAPKSHGIVPPGVLGNRTQSNYSYDPARARQLLSEAGVEGLEVELKTLNSSDRLSAAQIVQANLAEIGISVEVIPLESGTFWDLGLESKGDAWKDLQMWIMQYGSSPDGYEPFQWFVGSQVGIWNWERWTNDEFDTLFQAGLEETDAGKREQIYLRMQAIMEDTGAYVWLTHQPIPMLHLDTLDPVIYPDGNIYPPWFEWTS
ncbi:MAG: ABC transporter substrate-binding protein [Alphaproteobacteria bacterium]